MEKLKRFAADRPVLFSALVMLASIGLTEIPLAPLFVPQFGEQAAHYMVLIFEQGLVGLALFVIVARFGWTAPGGLYQARRMEEAVARLAAGDLLPVQCGGLRHRGQNDRFHPAGEDYSAGADEPLDRLVRGDAGPGGGADGADAEVGPDAQGHNPGGAGFSGMFGIGHIINLITGRFPVTNNLAQMAYGTFSRSSSRPACCVTGPSGR